VKKTQPVCLISESNYCFFPTFLIYFDILCQLKLATQGFVLWKV